jgi:hypothetical protein
MSRYANPTADSAWTVRLHHHDRSVTHRGFDTREDAEAFARGEYDAGRVSGYRTICNRPAPPERKG